MLDWMSRLEPAAVAIDAPQGYNRRLLVRSREHASSRSRVCDHELLRRRISLYQVPSRKEVTEDPAALPAWMRVGLPLLQGAQEARLRGAAGGRPRGRLRGGAGSARGLPLRDLRDPARRAALEEEHARGPAAARARPARSGRALGHRRRRLLRPRLARRARRGAHGVALRPGQGDPVGDEREGLLWLPGDARRAWRTSRTRRCRRRRGLSPARASRGASADAPRGG